MLKGLRILSKVNTMCRNFHCNGRLMWQGPGTNMRAAPTRSGIPWRWESRATICVAAGNPERTQRGRSHANCCWPAGPCTGTLVRAKRVPWRRSHIAEHGNGSHAAHTAPAARQRRDTPARHTSWCVSAPAESQQQQRFA